MKIFLVGVIKKLGMPFNIRGSAFIGEFMVILIYSFTNFSFFTLENTNSDVKTVDGTLCWFPFTYAGQLKTECITTQDQPRPWCSLTENYDFDGQRGICEIGMRWRGR